MLYIDPSEIEIIPSGPTACADCRERKASWKMKGNDGETKPFCGWCVMYGNSEWARLNAEELVAVGAFVRTYALKHGGPRALVPELDERHRLLPDAADRYVMGVVTTSRLLAQGQLGRLIRIGAAAELDDDD